MTLLVVAKAFHAAWFIHIFLNLKAKTLALSDEISMFYYYTLFEVKLQNKYWIFQMPHKKYCLLNIDFRVEMLLMQQNNYRNIIYILKTIAK